MTLLIKGGLIPLNFGSENIENQSQIATSMALY